MTLVDDTFWVEISSRQRGGLTGTGGCDVCINVGVTVIGNKEFESSDVKSELFNSIIVLIEQCFIV